MVVNHGWSVAGERQSAGGSRVAMVVLVQQAVDVGWQTGCGAHGVVPQDVDHIVQSVQSVLHLRLQTPTDRVEIGACETKVKPTVGNFCCSRCLSRNKTKVAWNHGSCCRYY